MRLSILCNCGIALTLASNAAVADDSRVTLYGVADMYFQYLGNGGAHSFSTVQVGS